MQLKLSAFFCRKQFENLWRIFSEKVLTRVLTYAIIIFALLMAGHWNAVKQLQVIAISNVEN